MVEVELSRPYAQLRFNHSSRRTEWGQEKGLQRRSCHVELVEPLRARLGQLYAVRGWRCWKHHSRHTLLPPSLHDLWLQRLVRSWHRSGQAERTTVHFNESQGLH